MYFCLELIIGFQFLKVNWKIVPEFWALISYAPFILFIVGLSGRYEFLLARSRSDPC